MKRSERMIPAPPVFEHVALAEEFGLRKAFVWDGSKLPTGTWKDYRSAPIAKRAIEEKLNTVVMVTAGNGGYALAKALKGSGVGVVSVVEPADTALAQQVHARLGKASRIVEADLSRQLSSEEIVKLARKHPNERIADVTSGQTEGYERIIDDIEHVYTGEPMIVMCPFGQGEGWVGLCRAIEKKNLHIFVVGVRPFEYDSPSAASALTAHHPLALSEEIHERIANGQGGIWLAHEAQIWQAYHRMRKHFDIEPTSAAAFAGVDWIHQEGLENAPVVFINSGKGVTA